MKIEFVNIQNFRRLKDCKIDFSEKETVFVGANNSGKTTAMDAMILFFKARNKFTSRDFTLSNWKEINSIGNSWIDETDKNNLDLSIDKWEDNIPTLDIWLKVNQDEIHYVNHLIPTLDWDGGSLGVRLRFEPHDMNELYKEFYLDFSNSKSVVERSKKKEDNFKLWPKNLWDFLEKKINNFFVVKTYLLNPALRDTPQKLTQNNIPIEGDAFNGLIKVDIINAQRGFSDVNSDGSETGSNLKNLSSQLRSYYDKHLNPSVNPTDDDIEALKAIQSAKEIFDKNLKDSFKLSLDELKFLNYPGLGSPNINLSSKFDTVETLNHDSSVQYYLNEDDNELSLPEKYNGLGYQNLISMIFKLIRFRDEWMQIGKSFKNDNKESDKKGFEPLHLVLIEEPEAHLHAQVQQVFIKEAYKVLRNNEILKNGKFTTQLIISTHSNHIAHEINFTSLRYFKRKKAASGIISTSTVVNLSETFGIDNETTRFAIRYLKTTHCDLFFADAVIIVEGPAERMLIPYFIKHHTKLTSCYISILEIGGSHAHTLKPLIENLEIITLVITDLDSISGKTKIQPEKSKGYNTGNDTLKKWIPCKNALDELLELPLGEKEHISFPIRVAYQIPLVVNEGTNSEAIYPYTFEDSLVMENKLIFKDLPNGIGLLGNMIDASRQTDIKQSAKEMYEAITAKGAKKAEFALELFYFEEPNKLNCPKYIKEGLDWLEEKLVSKKDGLVNIVKNQL
ncbi:MAG: putative ATP-dependent endonuclease of the family [Ferruginibacter sp.]|nr:putative ATP-dependent endonuclease of the family [Ferruginibacter sp.]